MKFNRIYFKRSSLLGILMVLISVAFTAVPVTAASKPTSENVIQSYNAGPTVLTSMLVELQPKNKSTVVPLTNTDIGNMLGVVIPTSSATIVLTPQNVSTQQVLVVPSGNYNTLVSNQNGPIKAGDYLTVSAVPGIAMKADSNNPLIIGRAVGSFNGTNSVNTLSLKNAQAGSLKVSVGQIAVDVQLAPDPLYLKNSNSILVFLTRAEYDVTNKPVSPARTYLCGLVFLATILITVVILYTGTRTSIVAVGRNPLASKKISLSMIKTIFSGLLVFAIGTASVYLILNK